MSNIEQRLAELEHFRALVMGSRLGGEIRGLELRRKQAQLDGAFEKEKTDKREAAAPQRKTGVKRFITECLEIGPGGETALFALAASYAGWAKAQGLGKDEVADESELLAAVRSLPGVLDEIVRAGPMSNKMPGLIGAKVVGEFRHEYDAVSAEQKPATATFSGVSAPGTLVTTATAVR